MGREVRKVPADWKHPQNGFYGDGSVRYVPLFDGAEFADRLREWDEDCAKWERGEFPSYTSEEGKKMTWAEYNGQRPDAKDYMPQWTPEQATHFMMYETTSEGTPISPAFATPEELARWLADNKASAFADSTASYESWLRVARGGYACSAVISNGQMVSGVEGLSAASPVSPT